LKPLRELRSIFKSAHRRRANRTTAARVVALCAAIMLLGCTPEPLEDTHLAVPSAVVHHTVTPGETIWNIAKLYSVQVIDIVERNNIKPEDVRKIEVGRQLIIPGVTKVKDARSGADPPPKPRTLKRYVGVHERNFIRPVKGRVAGGFGSPTEVGTRSGIDFRAAAGASVRAAKSGLVLECASIGGWGRTVLIDHGSGQKTFYAHLASVKVEPGEKVKQGQVIAEVGDTGRAAGPTLHFRIYQNGKPVDPRKQFGF
jgi:LysM repeat protein